MEKDSDLHGEDFTFADGTTMRVRERSGDSLRGIHIVKKTAEGIFETTDAEKGQISKGTDSQVMRIILYDVRADLGPKGRFTADQTEIGFIKKLDKESLEKIGRDFRRTNR